MDNKALTTRNYVKTITYDYCGLVLVDYVEKNIMLLKDDDKVYVLYKTQDANNTRREQTFKNLWLGRYKNIYYDSFYVSSYFYNIASW